ncbi:MAG: signal peptidase II [Clostridiales bacterium]|nr:signal peptidase II [Clostridiales bacterium]
MENNEETKSASVAIKKFLKTVWEYIKIAKIELIVMIALFAIDLISKSIVNSTIEYNKYNPVSVTIIPNFLRFTNLHNDGAVFGSNFMNDLLGDTGSIVVFSILAIVATAAFLFFMVKNRHGSLLFRVALGMLAAGAMGNCIDRMVYHYVRDFIEIVYFGLTIFGKQSFYVFNIADAALVIGVIMIMVYFIFFYREKEKEHKPVEATSAEAAEEGEDGESVSAVAADESVQETDGAVNDKKDDENAGSEEMTEQVEAASQEDAP